MTTEIDKVFPASDAINAFQRRIIAGVAGVLPFGYVLFDNEIISISMLQAVDFSVISIFAPAIVFSIYAAGVLYETILFRIIIPGVFFAVRNVAFPITIYRHLVANNKIYRSKYIYAVLFVVSIPIAFTVSILIIPFGLLGLKSKAVSYEFDSNKKLHCLNTSKIKSIEVSSTIICRALSRAESKYINDSINSLKSNVVYGSIIGQFAFMLLFIFYPYDGANISQYDFSVFSDIIRIYLLYTISGVFAFYPFKSEVKAIVFSLSMFLQSDLDNSDAP